MPPHYILGSDYTPHPDYPWSARRRGREGVVVLRLDVASTGEVLQTSILQSSGEPVLDQAATEALSRWRLTPARENGKPVAATITVPIRFVLG